MQLSGGRGKGKDTCHTIPSLMRLAPLKTTCLLRLVILDQVYQSADLSLSYLSINRYEDFAGTNEFFESVAGFGQTWHNFIIQPVFIYQN